MGIASEGVEDDCMKTGVIKLSEIKFASVNSVNVSHIYSKLF